MKPLSILMTLLLSLLTTHAIASQLTCSARDKGWEEHWGGHRDCGECTRKHGSCIETCSLEYVTCQATGTDYLGNSISITGSGEDRYDAERVAVNLCQRNFANCRVSNCSASSEEVSSRMCPNEPPPAPKPNPAPAPKPNPAPAPKPNPAPAPKPTPKPGEGGGGHGGGPGNGPGHGGPGHGGPGNGGPGHGPRDPNHLDNSEESRP